ncbi:MAG: MaoC family dehydratase N-terminal domain-containing protein [Novosphingobium sp.]
MSDYAAWIGREETRRDFADPALFARWLATLDRAAPDGGLTAQGFHWCLATPDAPTATLGPDGHPRRDDSPDRFLPPVPLPRRMWAASTLEFVAPLTLDRAIERRSRIASIAAKTGASGPLTFVEIAHETLSEGRVAVREVQSLVYRAAPEPGTPPAPPPLGAGQFDPGEWQAHCALVPGEALLFRYSALTFNSHRIHYDLPYTTGAENYRGLVVHGPLTATLLLDLAARELGDNALKRFTFRGVSPAIAGEMLHLVLRSKDAAFELGAFAADGRQVMSASAA